MTIIQNPKFRKKNVVLQRFADETLIYDLEINKAFCLNKTTAMVWELCDGNRSVAEIANMLNQNSNELINEYLVWLALDQLKQHNLLTDNDKFDVNFNGLSRRQVIRKIGLASMVTLPVISSVLAPQAVAAQSCGTSLQPCSPPGSVGSCCQGEFYCLPVAFGVCVPCVPPNQPTFGCAAVDCNSYAYQCCSGSIREEVGSCDIDTGEHTCICN